MFSKKTELKINEAVVLEIINAVKVYGAEYHSYHEGYAVLLEEIEETEKDLDYIKNHLSMMWDYVKMDDVDNIKANARYIAHDAVEVAKEACQIAAVARKILGETNYVRDEENNS